MEESFIPGDIVRARVESFGDSRKLQLSTAYPEGGVVFALSQEGGVLMYPQDWQRMVCPVTQTTELRKVAKPEL